MLATAIELVGAPLLVAVSTLACRRWGTRTGGVVSAFPAIVGPVLLITALGHDAEFTARAANGVLLGLVSLSAFALAYGRLAERVGWKPTLLGAWACAGLAALTVALGGGALGLPAGLIVATASLTIAFMALPRALPAASGPARTGLSRLEIPTRMAAAALLVTLLSAAASRLGPLAGGILAALPVLASVLAVFTHRRHGAREAAALLRGMLAGMAGFVAFCEIVATLVVPAGAAAAFLLATVAALAAQAMTVGRPPRVSDQPAEVGARS